MSDTIIEKLLPCPLCGSSATAIAATGAVRASWEAREAAEKMKALVEENARLRAALGDIANAVRMGAETDLMAWHNLAHACQTVARTALRNISGGDDDRG